MIHVPLVSFFFLFLSSSHPLCILHAPTPPPTLLPFFFLSLSSTFYWTGVFNRRRLRNSESTQFYTESITSLRLEGNVNILSPPYLWEVTFHPQNDPMSYYFCFAVKEILIDFQKSQWLAQDQQG